MSRDAENLFADDDARWRAVLARDGRADGRFVYAVRTTGIYCRPTCPSRRPDRRHVALLPSREEAERAGFRPCKRCRPDAAVAGDAGAAAVRRACALIDGAEEPPALADLAQAVGMSRFHFHRVFKRVVGLTPGEYAAARRVERLRRELEDGAPVTAAIYDAGFGSSSRVYETAAGTLGMTPAAFRAGAPGRRIRFALARTWLGCLLVAATERGICTIELGDAPEALRERLAARFPRARLEEGGPELDAWVERVAALVAEPGRGADLPLDVRGTAFQHRVWRALQDIPPGATRSYAELARSLDAPRAARAVARACASNPVAVAIPCHRVVRDDGGLGGYRWGLERKRALLERERAGTGD